MPNHQIGGPSVLIRGSEQQRRCAAGHTIPNPACLRCCMLTLAGAGVYIPTDTECQDTIAACIELCSRPTPPDLMILHDLAMRAAQVAHYKEHCADVNDVEYVNICRAYCMMREAFNRVCLYSKSTCTCYMMRKDTQWEPVTLPLLHRATVTPTS